MAHVSELTVVGGLRNGYRRLPSPADQFDDYRAGDPVGFVDFNPAGGGEGEPAPREDCHGLISARKDVLVIEKVAFGFIIVGVAYVDREPMAESGEKLTLHYSE